MTESGELTQKTFNGAKWSLGGNVFTALVSFVVGIILARILSVEQYGFLGMIAIFIAISNAFIDSGFTNALIRKKEVSRADYNTIFYFNVGISIFLFFVMYVVAVPIAAFYKQPLLVPVTRVVSISLIINAIGLVQIVVFTRKVDFKIQSIVNILATIIGGVVGIILAVFGYGVWSIVWQQIVKQGINTLLMWVFCSWRPDSIFSVEGFSKASFKEMFSFGSNILGAGLLGILFDNAAYMVIGKMYSPTQLGYYKGAEQFSNFLSTNYAAAVQKATFPTLSTIQDNKSRLKGAFIRVFRSVMMISVTLCLFLAATAKPLILSLLGEKWANSVIYLQLLCIIALFFPLHVINLNILQVKGRSDWYLKLEFIKRGIQIIPILIGIYVSVKAMLLATIVVSIVSLFINSSAENKLLGYSFIEEMRDILKVFWVAAIIAIIILCVQFIPISCYGQLAIQIIGGCALFHFVYTWIKQPQYIELKELALSYLEKNNNNEKVE